MKNKNRYISLVLSLILIFNFPFTTKAANVPLSEEVKVRYTFYKAMVLLGIYAKNRQDVANVIDWGINKLPELYTFVENGVKTAKEGFLNITDSLWNSSRSKVQENFKVGDNYLKQTVVIDGYPSARSTSLPYSKDILQGTYISTTGAVVGLYFDGTFYSRDGKLYVKLNSRQSSYFPISTYCPTLSTPWADINYSNIPLGKEVEILNFPSSDRTFASIDKVAETFSYTGSDVVAVSDWDYVNPNTKERSVVIPQEGIGDYTDVVGNTYTDYVAENISSGEVVVPGNPGIDLTLPGEVALDFSPLYINLKDKFPFCIPFDLIGSIRSFSVSPEAPVFKINFDKKYFLGGGTFDIDFSRFNKVVLLMRYFMLIVFVVNLIKLTNNISKS